MLEIENYRAIFDSLPTASAILQPVENDYNIVEANTAYLQATKTSHKEVVNQRFFQDHLTTILQNPEKIIPSLRELLERMHDSEDPIENKVLRCHLSNDSEKKERYWQFIHTPINGENGELNYIIHTLQDVTDELTAKEKRQENTQQISSRNQLHIQNRVLENQIAKKINQYEAASKELNDFIYSVSHDLRAPLRRIDGFSQELMNEYVDQLDDMGAHYLKRVRQGAQDMGNLIDDLLKLSRISRRTLEVEEFNLSKLVNSQFVELIGMEPDRDVNIDIEKNVFVKADRGLIKAMVINLLSNALKFTAKEKQAQIEFGSNIIDNTQYYYIKDNGVGFDPEYSNKLFKAFDRLHSQKEFKGTGIGLATVKRIVNLHGGTIWAEGTPGEGATFYFNFHGT